ncbi:dentin sialophosphoprotein-like isoform X2 [Mytilus californianus]|uniref:dentin sialophosphoprotein-like isoform X2 n=1 Tax=Mytilus californianus TaxID=6549 RepID=UPI002245BC00|nr:dentin sialophosphoprotein-like isoform X2 [Mytilus californianus]XP_052091092.1 dentin sialophosphoprotein-like isoform X2 [Mytilus californianus]
MIKFYWLILLSICFAKVYSQCSGATLVVELQLFTTIYIESPNFQSGNYSQNLNCSWRVITSLNTSSLLYRVQLKTMVNTMDILKIFKGLDDTGGVLIDTTNNDSPDQTRRGTASVAGLYVQFTSDDDPTNNGKGFTLNIIESSDMSGTACSNTSFQEAESTPKFITSPNFPINYLENTECSWNISSTDNSVIVISVVYMDIEKNSPDSCYDSLQIGDSGKLCADEEWHDASLYAYNDSVSIKFISDFEQNKRGFVLSYMMLMKDPKTTENIEEQKTSTQPVSTSLLFTTITGHETSSDSPLSSTQTFNSSLSSTKITEPQTTDTYILSTQAADYSVSSTQTFNSSLPSTKITETQTTNTDIPSTQSASTSSLSITTSSQIIVTVDSSTKLANTSLLFSTITELLPTIETTDQSTTTKDSSSSLFSTILKESNSTDIKVSSTRTRSTSLLSTTSFTQTTDTTDSSTWRLNTSMKSPTTIDSLTAETAFISSTIALETTTEDKEQLTTSTAKPEVEKSCHLQRSSGS